MSKKLTTKELSKLEAGRNVWQEALAGVKEIKAGGGRRRMVEPKTEAARSRIGAGLSLARFAELLGVSRRTLEQWEQGRREPSGAAKTLIRLAALQPQALAALR